MDRTDTKQCEFINPDKTCVLMQGLADETDPRCKLWRDDPKDCTYLRLYVLKGRGLHRGGWARRKRKEAEAK